VTGLRGLNGLDFMLDGEGVSVLEVNPRPTASFELYDADIADGLINWHVRSFRAQVPELSRELDGRSRRARAYRILFAEHDLRVPEGFEFPQWCRDLPNAGSAIATGAPVMSVFAEGETPEVAQAQLTQRTLDMRQMLARWKVDARADCAV
jgi:predicted ATP-grasp superfamily ATP-dependent carboligase